MMGASYKTKKERIKDNPIALKARAAILKAEGRKS